MHSIILDLLLAWANMRPLAQFRFWEWVIYRYSLLLSRLTAFFVACGSEWVTVAFNSAFSISTEVVYLQHCLIVTWLVPCETATILAHSVCTLQPCTMSHLFMQSHMHRRVHACLAVTCHLHFWQNGWNLLHVCYWGNTGVELILK